MDSEPLYIVTGATGSIGTALALNLARQGKRVLLACRDAVKAAGLRRLVLMLTGNRNIDFVALDLSDFSSVIHCAAAILAMKLPIAALINNAGVMNRKFVLTGDGFEQTFQVNYFSAILFTRLLLPAMSPGSRIVFTTSVTRRFHRLFPGILSPSATTFSQLGTYGESKLALTHYALHLAEILKPRGITVNCADPGVVNSAMITMNRWFDPIADLIFRPLISSPEQGASSALAAIGSSATAVIFHHRHCKPIYREVRRDRAHTELVALSDALVSRVAGGALETMSQTT